MTNKILDFTPEQYKDWCLSLLNKDLKTVSEYQQKYHLSAKAVQIKELMLKCRDFMYLFEYTSRSESAYRSKNNVPNTQRVISFKPVQPDSIYYNFLTNDWVNSQLPMLTSDYYFFINRLKYASIFIGAQKATPAIELISSLGKSGELLTADEKDFIKRVDNFRPQFDSKQKEYQANYGKQSEEFYKVNTEMLQPFFQEKKGANISIAEVETYLANKKVEFSEKEKAFLEATKKFEAEPVVIKFKELDKEVSEFVKNHQSELNELIMDKRNGERNLILNRLLGISKGFASDVMTSQDYCRTIVAEKTPVSKEKLQYIQKKISDPFITSYISKKNQEVLETV